MRSEEDLARVAAGLGSDDAGARAESIRVLSTLPESALPALRERLVALRRGRPPQEEVLPMLHDIRRATGSRRADDLVDIAGGVSIVLGTRRDRPMLKMVEPILLQRSLERIATTDALVMIPEVLRLDRGAWEMEGRRATLRLGDRAAAAILRSRGHEDIAGREWARWSISELDLEDPGRLVQRLSPRDLADVLLAWGETHSIDAMPVVASYVDDPRRQVRASARAGLLEYGQNAIWQAREQFRLRPGESADESWGWQRTMDELFRRLDDRRSAGVRDLEAAARTALDRGDAAEATRQLDLVLARAPDAGTHEIADLFARAGDAWMSAGDGGRARVALERAIRLAPSDPDRARWDARLAFLDAEDALAGGVIDLEQYRRAAAADPGCARCREVLASLDAQQPSATVDDGGSRRLALWIASALIALVGLALLWTPRRRRAEAAPDRGEQPGDDVDPADATLSG